MAENVHTACGYVRGSMGCESVCGPLSTAPERDWWDRIGEMRWQHIVLIVVVTAAFVALCFAPDMACGISVDSAPTSTQSMPHIGGDPK